uniref:Metal-binding protein n=1 Tax=Cyanothece sp. (strain PCC 7425 / ATCC 29141) TaxID=395961 RepID=B8HTG8_CYAP4
MPAGRTHDRITLSCLPFLATATWLGSRNLALTGILSTSFLFSGLMFGPDLDIHSCQYRRWGWLRWIWLPYQKTLRHRSFLSHGPIMGTALRLLYLGSWLALPIGFLLLLQHYFGFWNWNWQTGVALLQASLQTYPYEWLAGLAGLELGAMSHSLSDWSVSSWKGWQRRWFSAKGRTKS